MFTRLLYARLPIYSQLLANQSLAQTLRLHTFFSDFYIFLFFFFIFNSDRFFSLIFFSNFTIALLLCIFPLSQKIMEDEDFKWFAYAFLVIKGDI